MYKGILKVILSAAVVLPVIALFVSGCGKLENKGSKPENANPVVFLANTPVEDSEWWRNPVIHWYATDKDGYVARYRYSVVRCDSIDDVDEYIQESFNNKFEDWVEIEVGSGKVATSGQIWIFSDPDLDSFMLCNYFFIQAEDNFGAQSDVVYRRYFRANHAPETYITVPMGPQVTGSCCEFQSATIGITVSWKGEDILDYPGRQPDFYYSWEVFGPFTGEFDSLGAAMPDTFGVDWDTLMAVDSSWDERTQSRWVMDKSVTLYDLFRNQPFFGETAFGYFVFKVKSRDDAYVPDPTPAMGSFMAIRPECELGLLLVDMTKYYYGPASLYSRTSNIPPVVDSLYHPYFKSVVEYGYGREIDGFWDAWSRKAAPPPIEEYARYKLIIVLAEDLWSPTPPLWMDFMFTYLNLGGKLMLMGVDHFFLVDDVNEYEYLESALDWRVLLFFDVRKQFIANWRGSYRRARDNPDIKHANEEFVEALSTIPDLPNLRPDSSRLAYYIAPGHRIVDGDPPYPWNNNAIPGVNYFVSGGRAERVYVAKSALGRNGKIDGGPCGYRFSQPCFKSAVFGFPLWPLEEESAREFMRGMIEWFDIE